MPSHALCLCEKATEDRQVILLLFHSYPLYIPTEQTIEREYAPLECIADNYEKVVVSLDDLQLPSRKGITHVRAWELSQML